MIRDQLIEHASCPRIREKLLVQTDGNLTLDVAVKMACQVEAAIGHVQTLTAEPQASVHVVKAKPRRQFKPKTRSYNPADATAASKQDRCCFRCGSSTHLADAPDCPARKVTCRSCNKTGHFARVCKSKSKSTVKVGEVVVLEMNTVLMLQDGCQDGQLDNKITCAVTINAKSTSCPAELVVDTGSAVSIIPEHLYREHFSDVPLSEPLSRLVTYTKSKVPVLGCLSATVRHANTAVSATLYVVKTGTAMLGLDLFRALRLSIEHNAVLSPATSSSAVNSPAAPVTEVIAQSVTEEKLGLAKGFIHESKSGRVSSLSNRSFEGSQSLSDKLSPLKLRGSWKWM